MTWSETSKPVPIPDMGGMWSAIERIVDMSMGTTRSCNWMRMTSYHEPTCGIKTSLAAKSVEINSGVGATASLTAY
ncbi:uncharacterized protein N7518_004394 [Penicillium psychrosexuale]|uniref:uncharacterized protein n=1 Tax=Penicillium psychrosexuale TaxID=1002107 RepID=UPI00254549E3|nr:uncharacterized protein N7518_004394 [Penicillium psychrosexuale]KAJ5795854.1 hypothetical protein N7518_004394 [Penicillium psychrosexuale]